MIDLRTRQRFARLVTDVVVRRPALWRLFRPLVAWSFDGIARDWDTTRVTPQHLAPLEAALERLAPPGRILDLGTGTGGAARAAAARWPDAEVVGVDVSAAMIEEARARASGPRQAYLVADAASLPFGDGSFDLVLLLNMIPFFDELVRVTASGGAIVVAFSRGPQTPIWVPPERVHRELEARGFSLVADVSSAAGIAVLARRPNAA